MSEEARILSQRFEENRRYTFGVVVLSQGKRLDDLNRGFESLLAQKGVDLDIVCVGNGWEPEGIPDQVKKLGLPENLGIPAGRNAGVPHVSGEFLFFLDDDAWLPDGHHAHAHGAADAHQTEDRTDPASSRGTRRDRTHRSVGSPD
jgi:hypothetical protein